MSQFTQLELSTDSLRSMRVNLDFFLGQHNHQIKTSFEIFWSVWETRVRNRFPPPTFLNQLEDVLQEKWYKIPLETVQNL
jgi:hypothetical protein